MNESLADHLQHQLDLQVGSFKIDPTAMTVEERIAFIHWNFTALTDELHEMMGEVGWKPWASSKHINEDRAVGEMIDAWHFFLNILLALQPHLNTYQIADRFGTAYAAKRAVNTRRQEDGYDGVSTKCPSCRRDLIEIGIRHSPVTATMEVWYCDGCGAPLAPEIVEAVRGR